MKKSEQYKQIIINGSEKNISIPIEGSLGLLALGAVGLKAWREAKKNAGITHSFNKTSKDAKKEE
jgi:hypothetical protein